MTTSTARPDPPGDESDQDLLTRTEASAYLVRFNVRLKPATLARIWSVGGDGPPCEHIRGKPWYPRGALREWARAQRTGLRRNRREQKLDPRVWS
ncbi:MAG: hypothetical protein AB1942_07890 [Pseudomonadota bacterium]|jgi:hypothetical protein|uniref:Uncharacterized protein n=1 Tax=Phenylobacterium kunshanense TaxID=1445034 RepID=A0A328BMP4_9CAUL|nr:hypothetical protein [Phenylobacterium kunshanense]PZQ64538.1 MAG: hypothetical protein DI570_05045 [Phenylobacterium zucineum]RAK67829.1 hypothetical protein DJ019_08020 [Phenylobacterium kunshanense]